MVFGDGRGAPAGAWTGEEPRPAAFALAAAAAAAVSARLAPKVHQLRRRLEERLRHVGRREAAADAGPPQADVHHSGALAHARSPRRFIRRAVGIASILPIAAFAIIADVLAALALLMLLLLMLCVLLLLLALLFDGRLMPTVSARGGRRSVPSVAPLLPPSRCRRCCLFLLLVVLLRLGLLRLWYRHLLLFIVQPLGTTYFILFYFSI
jgi:hypothetical protein